MKQNEMPVTPIPSEARLNMLSAVNARCRRMEGDFAMLDIIFTMADEPEFHALTKEIKAKAAEWADRAQKLIIDQQAPAAERR